jgi:hypothetical protein
MVLSYLRMNFGDGSVLGEALNGRICKAGARNCASAATVSRGDRVITGIFDGVIACEFVWFIPTQIRASV